MLSEAKVSRSRATGSEAFLCPLGLREFPRAPGPECNPSINYFTPCQLCDASRLLVDCQQVKALALHVPRH